MSTYALIPGGGGDPWEWHLLVPELAARGHDALQIRLPADDDSAGWTEYADAVVDALGDRRDIILVAESMGAFTAPIVSTRRPVELLVLPERDDPGPRRDLQHLVVEHRPLGAPGGSTTPASGWSRPRQMTTPSSTTTMCRPSSERRRRRGRGRISR